MTCHGRSIFSEISESSFIYIDMAGRQITTLSPLANTMDSIYCTIVRPFPLIHQTWSKLVGFCICYNSSWVIRAFADGPRDSLQVTIRTEIASELLRVSDNFKRRIYIYVRTVHGRMLL